MTPRPRSIGRARAKLARSADASGLVALHVARGIVERTETKLGELLMKLSRGNARELARRHRERPGQGSRWFTGDERALVEVLAALIVPSDAASPGAEHMDVMGRSAGETLDRLVAGSPHRQAVYARGLLALDRLAEDTYRARFVDVSADDQVRLLQLVDRLQQKGSTPSGLRGKVRTKLGILHHKWSGVFPALELFPRLVQDVLQAFYTNRTSWVWLGYDGPPMPAGYPQLLERRPLAHEASLEG